MKVNVYIDGYNFYHGLKANGWQKYYWLDIVALFEQFMQSHQTLNKVLYFSSEPIKRGQRERQDKFFSANKSNPKFELILGRFIEKDAFSSQGVSYKTYEEKETDVNIAVKMIENVVLDNCAVTILVTGDSDLAAPIKFIRGYKENHPVVVMSPPLRHSNLLQQLASAHKPLKRYEGYFKNSPLPNKVKTRKGDVIYKPIEWV